MLLYKQARLLHGIYSLTTSPRPYPSSPNIPPIGPWLMSRARGPATALTILHGKTSVSSSGLGSLSLDRQGLVCSPFRSAYNHHSLLTRLVAPGPPSQPLAQLAHSSAADQHAILASVQLWRRRLGAPHAPAGAGGGRRGTIVAVDEVADADAGRVLGGEGVELGLEEDGGGRGGGVEDGDLGWGGGRGGGGGGRWGEGRAQELVGGGDAGAADNLR